MHMQQGAHHPSVSSQHSGRKLMCSVSVGFSIPTEGQGALPPPSRLVWWKPQTPQYQASRNASRRQAGNPTCQLNTLAPLKPGKRSHCSQATSCACACTHTVNINSVHAMRTCTSMRVRAYLTLPPPLGSDSLRYRISNQDTPFLNVSLPLWPTLIILLLYK